MAKKSLSHRGESNHPDKTAPANLLAGFFMSFSVLL